MEQYIKTSNMPPGQNVLIRPRIDAMMDQATLHQSVVVSAGAGFGKTLAVGSYLERSTHRGVWQQLTLLDNLPMRFWESFVYTVSLHRPTLAEKLEQMGFPDSLYNFHQFLHFFTEELYKDDQFVVFVFDDFHLITDESVLDFFHHFVSANLENISIVFITRNTNLEMFHGPVYVISTESLRFTKSETNEYFVHQDSEINASIDLEKIYNYTKGWPVALFFIGLQIAKGNKNIDGDFLNSKTVLFKIIDKEIFAHYTDAEKQFFVLLSQLNFFPKDLVANSINQNNALELLGDNVFVSYDEKAKAYYLHQIFLDFLADKTGMVMPSMINETLMRAGDWCYKNKYYVDAITYYEKSGNEDKVAFVLQGFEGMRHSRSDAKMFLKYIENFSEKFMNENIMFRIVYAMTFINNLEVDNALNQIKIAQKQLSERDDSEANNELRGEACTGEGLIYLALGKPEFVELFRKADALLPDGSHHWGQNLRLIEYSNVLHMAKTEEGAIDSYVDYICQAIPHINRVLHDVGYGVENLAKAEASFLRGDFKTAQTEAYKAVYKAEEKGQFDVIDNALFLLIKIFLAVGAIEDIEKVVAHLQRNKELDENREYCVPDVAIGWYYSELGEIDKIESWIVFERDSGIPPVSADKDVLLQIRCMLEKRDYAKALALTEKLQSILGKRSLLISMAYLFVYRAIIQYNLNDYDSAAVSLKEGYEITYQNQLIMPFVEYGHRTRAMLGYFRENGCQGVPNDWLADVHTKASTYAKRRAYVLSKYRSQLPDFKPDFSLTERELELIRNMSQGLTREEIASSMFISPHTVKSMLKIVYNKMGAVNSSDAIRIAVASNLIQ